MEIKIEVIESFEYRDSTGKKKNYLAGTEDSINEERAQAVIAKGWAKIKKTESEPDPEAEPVMTEPEKPKRNRK